MKSVVKIILTLLLAGCGFYLFYNFLADASYGEQNWLFRKMSDPVAESVKRGVFVKKLNYEVDSFSAPNFFFEAFIEKAFTHGHKSLH